MTPDCVWLTDLNPDHLRIVRNALEPLGWRLGETRTAGSAKDTPDGAIEIQIREWPPSSPTPPGSLLPTLWLLQHGSTVPRVSGDGLQDFARLPIHCEELAARVRSLARLTRLELELHRNQRELAHQIQRGGGQIGMLAGEVTTRLRDVMGYLDLLLDGTAQQVSGPQRRLLVEAKGAAERVAERVEDLADASRAESGFAIEVRLDRLELKPLLDELLEWSIPRLRSSHQELAVYLEPDTPPVCGDPERLAQALRYLIDDAHRFSPAGTRIEIGAVRDPDLPGFARITIADEGPGPDAREERLRRGCPERGPADAERNAVGIGLSIARAVAIALGGELQASHRSGGGTRIGVRLPLWNSRASRIAQAQAVIASSPAVSGSAWLCRATAQEELASLCDVPSLIPLSPGEVLAISDDPPAGVPRLGRVRDLRGPGSLAKALLPQLRVMFCEDGTCAGMQEEVAEARPDRKAA